MRLKEIKPGMVIHCKTQEEANILCGHAGIPNFWGNYWKRYGNATCYRIEGDGDCIYSYGNIDSYVKSNYKITEFSDLLLPELTAEEVVEWLAKNYEDETYREVFGRDYLMSNLLDDMTPSEVVEKIAHWKSDHEKKEPEIETEWFWQGRIFRIHEDGCYYQIKDGTGFYDTGCEYRESAEEYMKDELKEYCKTHEGEFIATVEHICRVKAVE